MLSLTSKLQIDSQQMNLASATIVTSLDPGFSEATIIVPGKSPDTFKEGQSVELYLGYERYGLKNEFSGTIESVSPKRPAEIRCCDYFYELRRKRLNRAFKNTTIEKILQQTAPGFELVLDDDAKSMKVSITVYARTCRWLIMKLATDYGFLAFFREKKLYFVKQAYLESLTDEAIFEEGVNIFEDSLYYHTSQKVGRVTVYSETKNGYLIHAGYGSGTDEKVYTIDGLANGE